MPKANLFVESIQPFTDVHVVFREIFWYQMNWPDYMENKASFLLLLIPEILKQIYGVIYP